MAPLLRFKEINMPINIRVHVAEKRSTTSQYENQTIGADIEASGLELHSAADIQHKIRELFQLARGAIQAQLLEPLPSERTNGQSRNGHNRLPANGNGNGRRSYGRPSPEPTASQKQLVRKLAHERNLGAEAIGAICQRVVGVELRQCTKDDISKLIDALLEEQAS